VTYEKYWKILEENFFPFLQSTGSQFEETFFQQDRGWKHFNTDLSFLYMNRAVIVTVVHEYLLQSYSLV
jgi:hypothetical protein